MSLLRITPSTIEFSAIGNVFAHNNCKPHISFPIQNGSTGFKLPKKIVVNQYKKPKNFCFVLHSDGINPLFDYSKFNDLELTSDEIATSIFNAFALSHDDATIIVIKNKNDWNYK